MREYHPEQIPRRGELVAWIATVIALAGWLALDFLNAPVFIGVKILAVLLVFAALSISLGNWMDRRTRLSLEPGGVSYENGLRKLHLKWEEIMRVEVIPSSWGNKVRVLGEAAHFDFRTLGIVRMQDEVKGRLGFEQGQEILETILAKAHLKQIKGPEEDYLYYSRS